jgi:hypothetical protein
MWKALCFLFTSLCLHFASVNIACGMSFVRDWFDQPLLTSPIRLDELDGAMIAKVVREETCMPLLYPKVVSVFDWMDRGDCRMITLEDLVKNPSLHFLKPRKAQAPTSSNPYVKYSRKSRVDQPEEEQVINAFDDRILLGNKNPLSLPTDDQLQAFLAAGKPLARSVDHMKIINRIKSGEYKDSPLKGLWRENPGFEASLPKGQSEELVARSFVPKEDPPIPPEFSSTFDSSEGVLNLRASKPSENGTFIPAQASQFYLTTQNLNDLLKGLSTDSAIADEVQSVAEIWAKAEKNRLANPEVALSVKSILLQAKVSKALTDPFGHAALKNLPPDDKYFLIGIDKDPDTNVVTIWSKAVEVNPGENLVELSPNDVIYQD